MGAFPQGIQGLMSGASATKPGSAMHLARSCCRALKLRSVSKFRLLSRKRDRLACYRTVMLSGADCSSGSADSGQDSDDRGADLVLHGSRRLPTLASVGGFNGIRVEGSIRYVLFGVVVVDGLGLDRTVQQPLTFRTVAVGVRLLAEPTTESDPCEAPSSPQCGAACPSSARDRSPST